MRPVNLLPERARPKRASGAQGGSAYLVIGALAVVLLAVVAYVLTANGINSKKEQAAKLSQQADAAEARAKTLSAFANFEQVKQTREQSVRTLASGRFDWERMLRELARLLPPGTYVTSLDATAADGSQGSSGSGGSSTSSASNSSPASASSGAGAGGGTGPTLNIQGCTRSHPEVATLLVRLRRLNRTTDVTLSKSSKNGASTAGGAGAGGTAPVGGAGSSNSDGAACGKGVSFDASVQFNPTPVPGPEGPGGQVPASLGGGS